MTPLWHSRTSWLRLEVVAARYDHCSRFTDGTGHTLPFQSALTDELAQAAARLPCTFMHAGAFMLH